MDLDPISGEYYVPEGLLTTDGRDETQSRTGSGTPPGEIDRNGSSSLAVATLSLLILTSLVYISESATVGTAVVDVLLFWGLGAGVWLQLRYERRLVLTIVTRWRDDPPVTGGGEGYLGT